MCLVLALAALLSPIVENSIWPRSVAKEIAIDQKLLEYQTRSRSKLLEYWNPYRDQSKIAWVLIPYVLRSMKRCLSIDIAIAINRKLLEYWYLTYRDQWNVAWVFIPYVSRSIENCLSIDTVRIAIDRKLLEYWNRYRNWLKIDWVLKLIKRDCLTIDLVITIEFVLLWYAID